MNPVQLLIDKAVDYIIEKDPSWERAQPLDFRIKVIERLKANIESSLAMNSLVHWQLQIGDQSFGCMAPIFYRLDWDYNPYLAPLSKPLMLV